MAKPKQIRETSNDLGRKINQVMAEKRMEGDYAKLAREFGISTPHSLQTISATRQPPKALDSAQTSRRPL